jgi:hypothetical protein
LTISFVESISKNNLEMIPVNKVEQNERWDGFENAATYSNARSIVSENKNKGVSVTDDIHSKSTMNTIE